MTDTTDRTSFDHAIKDEDIARAKSLVGHDDVDGGSVEYYSEVTRDAIRNFAMSYGDDNPLYVDFEHGKGTRWGAQIAPQMIINCLSNPTYGDPMPEEMRARG